VLAYFGSTADQLALVSRLAPREEPDPGACVSILKGGDPAPEHAVSEPLLADRVVEGSVLAVGLKPVEFRTSSIGAKLIYTLRDRKRRAEPSAIAARRLTTPGGGS